MATLRSSPLPPPPPPSAPRSQLDSIADHFPANWTPGDNDMSLMAADWRARKGLSVARRVEAKHEALAPEVAKLSSAVAALTRVAKWVGGAFAIVWIAQTARIAWEWLAALHH